jgi:hypothetical protein
VLAENPQVESPSRRSDAIALFEGRNFEGALKALDECLARNPSDVALLNYKARAFEQLGRLEEALSCIELELEAKSNDVTALCNRTALLTRLSRREDALASLDQALRMGPQRVDLLVKRARLLFQLGRREESLSSAERAVGLSPRDAEALNTRGMILDDLGRRAEALADFERILSIDPGHAEAITNCGVLYGRSGRFADALACYDRSLSLNPDQPPAVYNRSVVRLVLGDWARGFAEFESRWKLFPHEATRFARLAPRWTGKVNLTGKTILLHHEQGYGDTLQFARYVPLVAERGARVILATPKALRRIMMSLDGSPTIVSEGDPTPAHDFHCPLMSLPLVFGTTPETVPAPKQYLRADSRDVERWSDRLGVRRRARIGIAWSGRRFPPINHARDMTFEAVRPLLALDADFICLQTDLNDSERAQLSSSPNAVQLKEGFEDFADTAGLAENLDLIITVDTAIAHLAGALGKPAWVMNRYATCWRWLLDRADSPWYPTLRLFRQPALGDWASVVREVMMAAAAFILEQPAAGGGRSLQKGGSEDREPSLPVMLQAALDQHNGGELESAVAAYRRVLEFFPEQFDTLHYLGVALAQLRHFEEALEPLSKAARLRPTDAVVHNHYGNALAGLSRYAEAIESYERAIACDGALADSHYNEGVARMALGQYEAAVSCHTEASKRRPEYAQAHNNRGVAYSELGQLPEALADYDRALEARPEFVDAWVNRSDVLRRLRRFDEAAEACAKALDLDSSCAEAHNGRGAVLADLGRYQEARESYQAAIAINPSSAEAAWNKGLIDLSHGNFSDGWKGYESRWRVKSLKLKERFSTFPRWRGESIAGKTVLLHSEQGYGDTIQFSRYCAELSGRGARVIFSVPRALKSLFASLKGVAELVDQSATPTFDCHCPLLSVPLALRTHLKTITAPRRYLNSDRETALKWASRLAKDTGAPRIGIAWSGSKAHNKDLERSVPLAKLIPILERTGQWISLQKEVRANDETTLQERGNILRFGEELTDFADTAALIDNLDLVITVDTAVAHLAGALGKPVWILLPRVADWRWLQDRKDSPWYPSAILFRQTAWGDWDGVVRDVAGSLPTFVASAEGMVLQSRA